MTSQVHHRHRLPSFCSTHALEQPTFVLVGVEPLHQQHALVLPRRAGPLQEGRLLGVETRRQWVLHRRSRHHINLMTAT